MAVLQITLESAKEHSHSTITAMHEDYVSPWLAGMDPSKVNVQMVYIVPKEQIADNELRREEKEAKYIELRARRVLVQVAHSHEELSFGSLSKRLEFIDSWPSSRAKAAEK